MPGCLTLYYIARKGGEAFLRKRFKEHHVAGGLKLMQRYGLLVVIVPALLPPPAPFKIFILLAGVAAIPVWQFAAAVFIARMVRYGGEGLLAVLYGERAVGFLNEHAKASARAVRERAGPRRVLDPVHTPARPASGLMARP